jgi:hypothetical protein
MIESQSEDVWKRTLLTGTTLFEIISSKIVSSAVIAVFYMVETIVSMHLLTEFDVLGRLGLIAAIFFLSNLVSCFIGICLATFTKNVSANHGILYTACLFMFFASGTFW